MYDLVVGDTVTVQGVIDKGHSSSDNWFFVKVGTNNSGVWCRGSDLELSIPEEPPIGSIVLFEGKAYTRFESYGQKCWGAFGYNTPAVIWSAISRGKVIFRPDESS